MNNMNDFLGFLFFETAYCPKCGQLVTRDEVEDNVSDDRKTFTCPYCGKESDVNELG